MCFDHKLKFVLFTLHIYIAVICKYCYGISLVNNFSPDVNKRLYLQHFLTIACK